MGHIITALYAFYDDWGIISQYMIGWLSPAQTSNLYCIIALIMTVCVLTMCVCYILTPLKWYKTSFLKISVYYLSLSVLAFVIGFWWLYDDYYSGKMVEIDYATSLLIPLEINARDFIHFGINNAIISISFFTIWLILIKFAYKVYNNYKYYG